MSTLKLKGSTSGYVELTAPATAGDNTITLPTTAGSVVVADGSGNVNVSGIITATTFSGNVSSTTGDFTITSGNLVLSSGNGIDFSATSGTGTSELLDDYEEGTWTPVPNGVTIVSGSPTYTGTYTRIGRAVHVSMFQTAGTITVATGNYFTGLPFTPANYHNTGSWSCAATGKSGVTNVFTNSAIYIYGFISNGTSLTDFITSAMYIV